MKQITYKGMIRICIPVLTLLFLFILPSGIASAAEATAVKIGAIDYEALTLQVYNNDNDIIYYSTDNQTWEELESIYNTATQTYSMDIAWISPSSDVTLYFKGDKVSTVRSVTIPGQNSSIEILYDKVEGEFTINNADEADFFEWRKTTDYYWNKVSLNETSASYKTFQTNMENLRAKGAKVILRIPQEAGTGASNPGTRPSAEITITIPARAAAPAVKVNSSKLTMNTTSSMEYYDSRTDLWIEFDGAVTLEDIAPKALYENGANSVTLQIRKSATSTTSSSKVTKITIPGQSAPPTIGGNSYDVTYYYQNSKLVMQFNNASKTNAYEYVIVKAGASFNASSAGWKTVTANSLMTLSASTAPKGCTIYVRRKGIDANTSTNVALVLASAPGSFTVTY